MAKDNEVQEGIGSKFTTKQKVIAGAVIVILIIVIWQVMGLFGGGGDEITPPAGPTTPQIPAIKPAPVPTPATPPMPHPAAPVSPPTTAPGITMLPPPTATPGMQGQQTAVSTAADLIKIQQDQQKEFLSSVNELQMLKLQKDIAETNQAIAAAKLATETTKKSINDLLAKPAPPPVVPASSYATSLVTPGQVTTTNIPPPPIETPSTSYVVISVSMQLNRWSAVLGHQGKLYNVSIGDVLPPDGSIVVSISRAGVILKKDKQTRKISLVPAI